MKILIVGLSKIKYMPYLNFYLDAINHAKHEIHVCYWNRDGKKEEIPSVVNTYFHEYVFAQFTSVSKIQKIKPFILFKRFVLKIMDEEQFDFVIFLHTLSGMLIQSRLKRGNYIFDYRDSTYEFFQPFKKNVEILVKNSYAVFVSSDGFRKFLPEKYSDKIYTSHNLLPDSLNHRNDRAERATLSDKIRIAFWGFIRDEKINMEIIKKIACDKDFELHYYGREQQTALTLKKYIIDNEIENVFFHGEYNPEDRYQFMLSTDIIHNLYSDRNMMLAMGNKYYDGIIFRIPQLCMSGSFMGAAAENAGVGLMCDPYKDDFLDKIKLYYRNINREKFNKCCDDNLKYVLDEFQRGIDVLKNI